MAPGFADVDFTKVRRPAYYGSNDAAADDFAANMRHTRELLTTVGCTTGQLHPQDPPGWRPALCREGTHTVSVMEC